ncbi:hypothetical protein [Nocardia sp. NPDC056000]|uniref:hypothetical protein n=1 Tax=Nocardia sp. NPDC056000 TaxID=3345674 RepID=UPI0035E37BE7
MGEQPMSENRIDAITFDFADTLPTENFPGPNDVPAEGIMVKRSVKWTTATDDALKAAAERKGMSVSELVHQFIDVGLAVENPGLVVNLADVWRVLATVAHPPAA